MHFVMMCGFGYHTRKYIENDQVSPGIKQIPGTERFFFWPVLFGVLMECHWDSASFFSISFLAGFPKKLPGERGAPYFRLSTLLCERVSPVC